MLGEYLQVLHMGDLGGSVPRGIPPEVAPHMQGLSLPPPSNLVQLPSTAHTSEKGQTASGSCVWEVASGATRHCSTFLEGERGTS